MRLENLCSPAELMLHRFDPGLELGRNAVTEDPDRGRLLGQRLEQACADSLVGVEEIGRHCDGVRDGPVSDVHSGFQTDGGGGPEDLERAQVGILGNDDNHFPTCCHLVVQPSTGETHRVDHTGRDDREAASQAVLTGMSCCSSD